MKEKDFVDEACIIYNSIFKSEMNQLSVSRDFKSLSQILSVKCSEAKMYGICGLYIFKDDFIFLVMLHILIS